MASRGRIRPDVPLSRARILKAAVRLADKDGLGLLSMRKLAEKLGVKAMSLYNHVRNKEDILDGITDVVAGEFDVPSIDAAWKGAMRQRAVSVHQVLLRHPWATMLFVSRINVGPAMLRHVDATLGCLRQAGFSYQQANHAENALNSYVYGFTLQESSFPVEPAEYPEAVRGYLSKIPADTYPYLNELAEHVGAGDYDGVHDLVFGLDLILDSLERRLHDIV